MKIKTEPLPGNFHVRFLPAEISDTGCPEVTIKATDREGEYQVAEINPFYAGTEPAIQTARLFSASKDMLEAMNQAIELIRQAQHKRLLTAEEIQIMNAMTLIRRKALYG